jgi:xanthine dehydrogenase YagR molybdenum-binding subunit
MIPLNVGTPCPMRAPGAASGLFALECALDEIALTAGLDPLELRRRNLPARHPGNDRPWSAQHLEKCYRRASEAFGWSRRVPAPGAMREGDEILGWGMATASWPAERGAASARVQLLRDGTALVSMATQDIGTGTYTIIAQIVAEITGLPLDCIQVSLGNSSFPEGPISGSSKVTATVGPAVAGATRQALERLLDAATGPDGAFAGRKPADLMLADGSIHDGARHVSFCDVINAARLASIDGKATSEPGHEREQYAFRSFGAHFVEVRWDPGLAHLRVARVVSAFDVGRVLNPRAARNQIEGAIVMGLGMALHEEVIRDPEHGRIVNDNLADYLLPVNLGTPAMEVIFLDHPDPHIGEFGARGVGEIGITGLPAAIANAVYHATGRRFRDLPITPARLLQELPAGR